ncbi:MAG: alpha/beta fold hydrolase [Candidatus Geothermincolia bacterium]
MPGAVNMRYMVKGHVRETESFDGTVIRYTTRGHGLPIVTANGVANTTTFWHCFEDHFSRLGQVICWDYRGHGRSDVPTDLDTFDIPSHARDLQAVLDHAGVDKAVLVGFSMGVQVILEFWRDNSDRVLALIPVNGPCANPFEAFGTAPWFEKAYTRIFNYFIEHDALLEAIGVPLLNSPVTWPVAKAVEIDRHRCSREEMDLYFEHVAKMGFANELRAVLGMAEHSAEDLLPSIDVPTLVIAGQKDGMCPMRLVKRIYRQIKGAELFVVPHGTHATLIEQPDAVNFRIETFLRKNGLL